ncbi:MAG: hypothetical protein ACW976_07090 [Candidatus Ranarchaeia archaeon]|jgi:hypothetical protein
MTAFEGFFTELKRTLDDQSFEIWPDFTPERDLEEFSIIQMKSLGNVLILNCATCDGPSDLRHPTCEDCVQARRKYAKRQDKTKINTTFLGRFYTLKNK